MKNPEELILPPGKWRYAFIDKATNAVLSNIHKMDVETETRILITVPPEIQLNPHAELLAETDND